MSETSRREFIATCCALSLAACNAKTLTSVKVAIGKSSDFIEGKNNLDFYRLIVTKISAQGKVYLRAMSKLCTHQSCLLKVENSSYICPCHGSEFSENGLLIKGPAKENLPYYKLFIENQQIYVDFSQQVEPIWQLECV